MEKSSAIAKDSSLSPKDDNIPSMVPIQSLRLEKEPKSADNGPDKDKDKPLEPVYTKSAAYWSNIEPTVDGMLGGLGSLSKIDIQSSEKFLKTLFKLPNAPNRTRALDCGAGIGRITKNLLIRFFDHVDIVEQDCKFVEQAKKSFLESDKPLPFGHVVDNFYCEGLQTFKPAEKYYDVIWIQWVLNYLTDKDLLGLLNRCRCALTTNGILIIKENCTKPSVKSIEPDDEDSSITRPVPIFIKLFTETGYRVIAKYKQKDFPQGLFPVWCFALVKN